MSDLVKLAQNIRRCNGCKLRRKCTGPVAGVGKPWSTIMAVGQAPGWEENKAGLPWVGQSGQFLVAILEKLGFSADDVFFTYLAKCYPGRATGGNLPPPGFSVAACSSWLDQEIALVQPMLILAVGAISMKAFGITGGIKKDSGKVYDSKYGIPVIPILSPDSLMQRMTDTPIFTTQLNIINTFLEGFVEPPPFVSTASLTGEEFGGG